MSRLLLLLRLGLACLWLPTAHAQLVVTTGVDEDDGDALPGNGAGSLFQAATISDVGNDGDEPLSTDQMCSTNRGDRPSSAAAFSSVTALSSTCRYRYRHAA